MSRDEILRLMRTLPTRQDGPTNAWRITRRQFVIGTAASPFVSFAPFVRASEPDTMPSVTVKGGVLTVEYGDPHKQWILDSAQFGPRAILRASGPDAEGVFRIQLKRATYPGTSLAENFSAWIRHVNGAWRIGFDFDDNSYRVGDPSNAPELRAWLFGGQIRRTVSKLSVGGCQLRAVNRQPLTLFCDCTNRASIVDPFTVSLPDGVVQASGASFATGAPSDLLSSLDGESARAPVTRVTFRSARLNSPVTVARFRGGGLLRVGQDSVELNMEGLRRGGADDALLILRGSHGRMDYTDVSGQRTSCRLRLDAVCLTGFTRDFLSDLWLGFEVAGCAFGFATERLSFGVCGDGQQHVLHLKEAPLSGVTIPVRLLRADLPIAGASTARLGFPAAACEIRLGGAGGIRASADSVGQRRAAESASVSAEAARHCNAQISIGRETRFEASLDGAELRVERCADLLDLRFQFRHYRLECTPVSIRLLPPCTFATGCPVPGVRPRLIVIFYPQHVQEEVFSNRKADAKTASAASSISGVSRASAASGASAPAGNNCTSAPPIRDITEHDKAPYGPARTLVAGPTRLVFEPDVDTLQEPQDLSIEHLLEWRKLSLVVHERALSRSATLEAQLASVGIDANTSRQEAQRKLAHALSTGPGDDQTAIESVTGLICSPDRLARFEPVTAPSSIAAPIFSVRLVPDKGMSMRALHARQIDVSFLEGARSTDSDFASFVTTLDALDRRQLVVLTSAFGLAALRRLTLELAGTAGTVTASYQDDPKGMVKRPQADYRYLSDLSLTYRIEGSEALYPVFQEGILMPQPFDEFGLLLSPYGATMNAKWKGEPPAPLMDGDFFHDALDLESYEHRSVYGRDMLVKVASKGFMFPLGHRASLIKLSQREVLSFQGDTTSGNTVAYQIRHSFLVFNKPFKPFPALGQPFDGRAFPCSSVTLTTTRTPDLAPEDLIILPWLDQETTQSEYETRMGKSNRKDVTRWDGDPCKGDDAPPAEKLSVGTIFWPRTIEGSLQIPPPSTGPGDPNKYGNELLFELVIDNTGAPVRVPLIYVDNAAAHDSRTMAALVRYYDQLPAPPLQKLSSVAQPAAQASGASGASATSGASAASAAVPDAMQTNNDTALLRVMRHGLTSRAYAASKKSGDTSFDTCYWLLSATGGLGTGVLPMHPVPGAGKVAPEPTSMLARGLEQTSRFLASLLKQTSDSATPSDDALEAAGSVYNMDALMEGADQPPYYPVVERMFIHMQSLDRLLGKPQGLIETGFDERYVRYGFGQSANPSEIFAVVLAPAIDLDVSAQGNTCGGVARPNARLAAVSRRIGLVGGKPLPSSGAPPSTSRALVAQGAPAASAAAGQAGNSTAELQLRAGVPGAQLTYDVSSANAGRFDPAQFFGGALSEAKLLGVIALSDIVRATVIDNAPKLVETVTYGEGALQDVLEETAKRIRSVAQGARDQANAAAAKLWGPDAPPDPATLLYPDVMKGLLDLQNVAQTIEDQCAKDCKDDSPALAMQLASASRTLSTALENTAENPEPLVIANIIAKLGSIRSNMEKEFSFNNLQSLVVKQLGTMLGDAIRKYCYALVNATWGGDSPPSIRSRPSVLTLGVSDNDKAKATNPTPPTVFDAVFGAPPQGTIDNAALVERFITHPESIATQLDVAVFGEALGRPLVEAWTAFKTLLDAASATCSWSREVLANTILEMLRTGSDDLRIELMQTAYQAADSISDAVATSLQDVMGCASCSPSDFQRALAAELNAPLDDFLTWVLTHCQGMKTDLATQLGLIQQTVTKETAAAANTALTVDAREQAEIRRITAQGKQARITRCATAVAQMIDRLSKPEKRKGAFDNVSQGVQDYLKAQVHASRDAVAALARQTGEELAAHVMASVTGLFNALASAAAFQRIASIVQTVAQGCNPVQISAYNFIQRFVLNSNAALDAVIDAAVVWQDQLIAYQPGDTVPDDVRSAVDTLSATICVTISRLVDTLDALQAAGTSAINCVYFDRFAQSVGSVWVLRRTAFTGIASLLNTFPQARALHLADPTFPDVPPDVLTNVDKAVSPQDALTSYLPKTIAMLSAFDKDIGQRLQATSDALLEAMKAASNIKQGTDALSGFTKVLQAERQLMGPLNAVLGVDEALFKALHEFLLLLAEPVGVLGNTVKTVDDALKKIANLLCTAPPVAAPASGASTTAVTCQPIPELELLATIAAPGIAQMQRALTLIDSDTTKLAALHTALAASQPVDVLATTEDLANTWQQGGPGVTQAISIFGRLIGMVMHGQIGALIDTGALQQALEDALKNLLPTKISLAYDWDTTLQSFPEDDPIFAMSGDDDPAKLTNDLTLHAIVNIDLLKQTREVAVSGGMRPFRVSLLGDRLDLLTLYFDGARFNSQSGSGLKFSTSVSRVEIGTELSFIQALQNYFSSGGNGFHVLPPLSFPPEIVVEYTFSEPDIPVGDLLFKNIAIRIAAVLPLDDRQASFVFSFASHENPFLISCMPYGGGGFVALIASARGITGFELQFQFGGEAQVKFGPLNAEGRLMAGIYIVSSADQHLLEGFVNALGEGSVACFSASVNLYVSVRETGDGAMEGSSTYSFSFKVGFFSVSYSVTAHYHIAGGKKNADDDAKKPALAMKKQLAGTAAAALNAPVSCTNRHIYPTAQLRVYSIDKTQNWKKFCEHVDI